MPALALFLIDSTISANESAFSDFGDLGTLLLGGFAAAVAVAIALTFVRLRLRDKHQPTAQFISISDFKKK